MRILLLFLLSVLTASGQAILRSPLSTNTWSSTIVITNGDRTTLSNVFNTANLTNRQIIIQPGRYNIEALVSSTAAPLQSYNWTNVHIEAYGAEIFQTLTNESDYWIGSNWVQVTVKGLKMTGTRFASGANVGDATMFRYKGVGRNVSWIDGYFSTFDQHGFNRHASSGIYTNLTYVNCHFDTFGWRTGVPVLGGDGVCIAPFGPNTRIENCSFYWNHRDIEPQGLNSGQTVRGLLIKNNYHTGFGTVTGSGTAEFIYILGDVTPGAYDGISIVGDYFEGVDVSAGNGPAAVSIHGVKGIHIQNCYITNVNNGIQFFAGNDSLNWVIQNNTIAGALGRAIHNIDSANAAGHQRYGLIQGNLIEDIQQAGISGCFADTRIANNLFRNNSIGGSQVYAAIQLETPDANDPCTNNVIEGNTFLDTAGTSVTEWGIRLEANVGNTQLGTNFFQNCITNVFDQGVGTDLIHGGGSGTPGGADTHVQVNGAGAFTGATGLTYTAASQMTVFGPGIIGNTNDIQQVLNTNSTVALAINSNRVIQVYGNPADTRGEITMFGPGGTPFLTITATNSPDTPASGGVALYAYDDGPVSSLKAKLDDGTVYTLTQTLPTINTFNYGASLVVNSASGAAIWGHPSVFMRFEDDFIAPSDASGREGSQAWSETINAAGDVVQGNGEPGRPGIIELRSAAGTADRASLLCGTTAMCVSNGVIFCEASVKMPILATTTEDYSLRIGFGDGATSPSTDGIAWYHTNNGVTATWVMAVSVGGTTTYKNSRSNALADTWTYVAFLVDAEGTNCFGYIGTSRANAAVAVTNDLKTLGLINTMKFGPMVSFNKTAGTTPRTNWIDYYNVYQFPSVVR